MKTPITFEKADILKLVYAYLKAKGFDIPSPENITYKGALQVTVQFEHELSVNEVEALFEAAKAPPPKKPAKTPKPLQEAIETRDEPDMGDIVERSQAQATRPGPFGRYGNGGVGGDDNNGAPDRPLGSGESYEYPRDK